MLCKKPYWKQKAHRILKLGTAILDNEILTVQPYNHRTTKIEKKTAQIHHGGVQIAQIKAAKEIEILNFLLVAFLRIAKPPGAFSWPS